MLQGKETVVGQDRCVLMTEHAEESALVLRVRSELALMIRWHSGGHVKQFTKSSVIQSLGGAGTYLSCRAKARHPVSQPASIAAGFLDSARNDNECAALQESQA